MNTYPVCDSSVYRSARRSFAFSPRWGGGGGAGVLSYKRLMANGDAPLDGVAFLRLIDYNGVAFSIELLEWGHTFSDFWG